MITVAGAQFELDLYVSNFAHPLGHLSGRSSVPVSLCRSEATESRDPEEIFTDRALVGGMSRKGSAQTDRGGREGSRDHRDRDRDRDRDREKDLESEGSSGEGSLVEITPSFDTSQLVLDTAV